MAAPAAPRAASTELIIARGSFDDRVVLLRRAAERYRQNA
jgi:hypothetical protein